MSQSIALETPISGAVLNDAQKQTLSELGQEALKSEIQLKSRKKAIGMTVRKPKFNASLVKRLYFRNNSAIGSHLLTALSSTFPIGEQFFVHSVRNVRDKITDETLQAQISAFIGQEAMHSLAHDQLNAHLRSENYNLDKFDSWLASQDDSLKKLPKKYQLAITVAFEHFTAILGEYLLREPAFFKGFDENSARLWIWHAIEESEHKSVAFDVYQTLYGDTKVRRRIMLTATTSFMLMIVRSTALLMWQDRKNSLPRLKDNARDLLLISKMIISIFPEYLEFYKKDFHPAKRDRTELLNHWRQRLNSEHLIDE